VRELEGLRTCWQGVVTGWYNSIKQISQVTSASKSFSNGLRHPSPAASSVRECGHADVLRRFLERREEVGERGRESDGKWSDVGRWVRFGAEGVSHSSLSLAGSVHSSWRRTREIILLMVTSILGTTRVVLCGGARGDGAGK
jgi:hypothetical protein